MAGENLRFFLSAGEKSGDRHAAAVVREIRMMRPDAEFAGVGGPRMREAGCSLLHDLTGMAVMWWADVFGNLREFIRVFEKTVHALSAWRPDVLIPVDYPGFNLRLADRAKQCGVPVLYFISPQVWAWWKYRIHPIAERVDRMAVVLPFEKDLYLEAGLEAEYVGHPVVDELGGFEPDAGLFNRLNLSGGAKLAGLLPGSRRREIAANLPMMASAAAKLRSIRGGVAFAAAFADAEQFRIGSLILEKMLPGTLCLEGHAHDLMASASFCFVGAGSATLELAFLGTPMAVVYRITPKDWVLAKLLMSVDRIGLANIVAGREVAPEFLTVRDRSGDMASAAAALIDDGPARQRCVEGLAEVRSMLGPPGAARRVAAMAVETAELSRSRRLLRRS